MSFASPLVLLGLLGLPLLAGYYLLEQRGRVAAAAAFASPAVQASVAPRRPRWRRHLPMLAILAAIALLIVAAAKPQRTVAVPVERASIMLATDVSGSMTAKDVPPTRLQAAKDAARKFVAQVPPKVNVGVMAFNDIARVLQSPTTDRTTVNAAITGMASSGGTATGNAIDTAVGVLNRTPKLNGKRPPAAIVLLSDGASTRGRDPVAAAQAARKLHIPVYTIALGTPEGTITVPRRGGGTVTQHVPPDPASLRQIARASGGASFTVQTAAGLKQVYEKLGSQLGHKKEKQQITTAFAGGAAVLLLAGLAMSLGWFGRLI
ncbi:MAG TPA: VWA domain-containing protein [Thermoleophilaceae bacterium]